MDKALNEAMGKSEEEGMQAALASQPVGLPRPVLLTSSASTPETSSMNTGQPCPCKGEHQHNQEQQA